MRTIRLKFLLFLLSITLLIDLYTGSSLIDDYTSFPYLGIGYKSLIILLTLFYSRSIAYDVRILVMVLIFVTVSLTFIDFANRSFESLIFLSKFLLFPLLYYALRSNKSNYKFSMRGLLYVVMLSTSILFVNQFLGIFGYGKATYVHLDIGTTGFYFDSNTYSLVFLILQIIILTEIITAYGATYWIFFFIGFFLLALSIATKSAMLGTLIFGLLSAYYFHKRIFYFLLLSITVLIFSYVSVIVEFSQISKFVLSYENFGFNEAVLSGRGDRVEVALGIFNSKLTMYEKILGISESKLLSFNGGFTENDFVDILLSMGVLGCTMIYYIVFRIVIDRSIVKRTHNSHLARFFFTVNVLLLFISFTGGHLMLSSSGTIFFALLNVYCSYKVKRDLII